VTGKLAQLKSRRESLVALAAAQRRDIGDQIEPLRQPLARVDQALAVVNYVKHHPSLLVGLGVVLVVLSRGPAGKWLTRGWLAWRTVQSARTALGSDDHQIGSTRRR
jgi:hypothetical protein